MYKKVNLEDVTFLIPVRLDTVVRLENLLMVIDFLNSHFHTSIYILEAATYNNHLLERLLPQYVFHHFIEDHDCIFHRTKYINQLAEHCNTPFLAVWDTDVIVAPEQIIQSVEHLRNDDAHFVYPYERKFLDTSNILRELYLKTRNLKLLHKHKGKMVELYAPNPVGGGFFAHRESYIELGMENERFYGWGGEDGERKIRWQTLGYAEKRVAGPLFHLTHERGINSHFHSSKQDDIKAAEVFRLYAMSREEMVEEIKTW